MNLPSACSKDDSSAPIYMWEWQPTFFDLDTSPTFSDKAFKVISIKKNNFKDLKKDLYQETCNLDGNTGHE